MQFNKRTLGAIALGIMAVPSSATARPLTYSAALVERLENFVPGAQKLGDNFAYYTNLNGITEYTLNDFNAIGCRIGQGMTSIVIDCPVGSRNAISRVLRRNGFSNSYRY